MKKSAAYCDQVIVVILLVIITAVPLFFDVRLFSGFDLSKITILYILTFTIIVVCSIKTIITCLICDRTAGDRREDVKGHIEQSRSGIFAYGRTFFLTTQSLNPPIIALFVVSGLATFFSVSSNISFFGAYKRYDGFLSFLIYIIVFCVIINFVKRNKLDLFLNAIISTACVASIYGILQSFEIDLYQWQSGFGLSAELGRSKRIASTFGHPAFFSAYLIMVLPLVMVKIFNSKSSFKTCLYMAILVLLTVAFYYTRTRATFLALIISITFFFTLIGRKSLLANKLKTITTLSLLIGISLFYNISDKASPIGRFSQDLKQSKYPDPDIVKKEEADFTYHFEGTMARRVFQYLAGIKIIYDYPILGIGPDTLGMMFPQYIVKVYEENNNFRDFENQDRIHNDFLDMMVSRGIVGLGAYAWFIFAYTRMVWKGCKNADSLDRVLIIGLCTGCLGYFVQNQFSFGHIPIITLFWFLVGMSVIVCSGKRKPVDDNLRLSRMSKEIKTRNINRSLENIIKSTVSIMLVCLMVILILHSLYRYKADMHFKNGLEVLFKNETINAVGNYEKAVRLNPAEIRYRNELNVLYMKMASILLGTRNESIHGNLPEPYTQEQATILLTNAIVGAEEVQRRYPNDYYSLFTLGQAYHILDRISEEDYGEIAFNYYKHAARLQPFKIEIRDHLSQLYSEKGFHEPAIHELKEAIRIVPDNPLSYVNLARLFIGVEGYSEAETVLVEFVRKNPNHRNILIHQLLSDVYSKTENWEKLLCQSKKIIQINSEDFEAQKQAIIANQKLGKHDDVRKICFHILESVKTSETKYIKFAEEILQILSETEISGETNTLQEGCKIRSQI